MGKSISELIDKGTFYWSSRWESVREKVLRMDRNECQMCKVQGRYRKGEIVHHVKHLQDRPDLALNIYDPETGERQLITVCKKCHEKEHPEAFEPTSRKRKKEPVTEEKWE